jgi:catechol 2,3-dioxygenase-like lactoylglutathione lyase family enzyme
MTLFMFNPNYEIERRNQMSEKVEAVITEQRRGKFGETFPVRLVSDFKKSQEYYRDVLGFQEISDWGHVTRDDMTVILQQAATSADVRPNALSKKRQIGDFEGTDYAWDSFVHVEWDDVDFIVEEVRSKGGIIAVEPFSIAHNTFEFRNAILQDLDGYNIILGGMRKPVMV